MVPQEVNYSRGLRLFQDVGADTLAQEFKCPSNNNPLLRAVTAASSIINESCHSVKLGIGQGSCFSYIASTTSKAAVIL